MKTTYHTIQQKIINRSIRASVFVVFLFSLGACGAPRGLDHTALRPAAQIDEISQSPSEKRITQEILSSGSATWDGPDGSVQFRVTDTYLNALGQNCKRLVGDSSREPISAAVCQDAQGFWKFRKPLY